MTEDYEDGYWSYWEYIPFNAWETDDWMGGWEDAEEDEYLYGRPIL